MRDLFTYELSEDPQLTDDQYTLNANPDIYVQVCMFGGYAVGEFKESTGMMYDHGTFELQSHAFAKAVELNAANV